MELAQQRMADALSGVRRRFLWRHLRPDGSEFTAEVMLNPAHSLLEVMRPFRSVTDTSVRFGGNGYSRWVMGRFCRMSGKGRPGWRR